MLTLSAIKGGSVAQRTSGHWKVTSLLGQTTKEQFSSPKDPLKKVRHKLKADKGRLQKIEQHIGDEVQQVVSSRLNFWSGKGSRPISLICELLRLWIQTPCLNQYRKPAGCWQLMKIIEIMVFQGNWLPGCWKQGFKLKMAGFAPKIRSPTVVTWKTGHFPALKESSMRHWSWSSPEL